MDRHALPDDHGVSDVSAPADLHIDIDDFNDLRYWSNRFSVAKWRIKEAVAAVGAEACAVERYLQRGAAAGHAVPRARIVRRVV